MPYFQNVLDTEFRGSAFSDSATFKVKGNSPNSSGIFRCWNYEPYNLSANATLTVNYSFSPNAWASLPVDITAGAISNAAVLASEIAAALNANATFASVFTAFSQAEAAGNFVVVRSNPGRENFKVYVSNGSAETVLRFNKKAGVAEMPSFFARHTMANAVTYADSMGILQQVDPTTVVGQQLIGEAGLSYSGTGINGSAVITLTGASKVLYTADVVYAYNGTTTVSTTVSSVAANAVTLAANWTGSTGNVSLIVAHADWQLAKGRNSDFTFKFQNITLDGSSRISTMIEYAAGSLPGDHAKKTFYVYSGAATQPIKVMETPYVLTGGDLITP